MPEWLNDLDSILAVLGAAVVAATIVLEPIARRTATKWDNRVLAFLHDVVGRFSLRRRALPPRDE